MLRKGLQHLATASLQWMGEAVSYRRGDDTSNLVAVPARTPVETESRQGVKIISHIQDFIFVVEDFPFSKPASGDVIDYDGRLYEVALVNGRAWEYSDGQHLRYRIHTRDIGDE